MLVGEKKFILSKFVCSTSYLCFLVKGLCPLMSQNGRQQLVWEYQLNIFHSSWIQVIELMTAVTMICLFVLQHKWRTIAAKTHAQERV